jgi:hypothetical protein
MGWIIGKGIGVPFRLGGSGLGSSYWTTPRILTDGTVKYRKGVRGGAFIIDKGLTVTGFAGIENVDWINIIHKQ